MSDEDREFQLLMERLRNEDPAAYDTLYSRYGDAIRMAVRGRLHERLRAEFDSLDFAQAVWASFLALPKEDYTFSNPGSLGRFLTQIARHKVIEVFRQRFRTQRRDVTRERQLLPRQGGGEAPVPGKTPTPSQDAIARERWDDMTRSLPAGQQAILQRLRDGYTHAEVAALLNVSVRSVERVVRRLKDVCGI
jgi:RNA polymerase sigma factor (sigma-70 family)